MIGTLFPTAISMPRTGNTAPGRGSLPLSHGAGACDVVLIAEILRLYDHTVLTPRLDRFDSTVLPLRSSSSRGSAARTR
jgi:hypothetical protein